MWRTTASALAGHSPHEDFMSSNLSSRRLLSLLIVVGVGVAACSDDKSSTSSTAPGASTTVVLGTSPATTPGLTGAGLNLGVLVPPPGLGATLFQAQQRGVTFAADDIASGGGVLGGPLNVTNTDTPLGGSEVDVVDAAVSGGARVLFGPGGSSSAQQVLPELARLNTVSCSASATLPDLTVGQDPLSLFRTALPDNVLTAYLSDKIVERRDADAPGAAWKVAIVARSDDYGLSVGNGLAATLQAAGLVPSVVGYNPQRVTFDSLAPQVAALKPDLMILVSYEEGPALLSSLVGVGLSPQVMVGLDGFFAPRLGTIAGGSDPTSLDGFTVLGTNIGDNAFLQRLIDNDANAQVAYAAQAYDCAVVLALSAEEVESAKAATIAAAVQDVTAGGRTCTTYADCQSKLAAGEDIDYDGVSGKLGINAQGDPTSGRFTTGRLQGGKLVQVSSTDIDFAQIARQDEAYATAAFTTKLQQALRFLGFYDGPIDGLQSPALTEALKAFQTSVGLPPTGVYDAATDAALRAALGPYAVLLSSTTVGIQELMTSLGFYTGPIDGIWSPELTASIQALQKELGVPQTGVLDAATLQAAYERGLVNGATTTTVAPTPDSTPPATTVSPTTVPPTTPPETTVAPPVDTTPAPPATELNLFQTLQANPDYSTFVELFLASGFNADAGAIGPYTVFAPTNEAFAKLPAGALDALKADPVKLQAALSYHIVEGLLPLSAVTGDLLTINGATIVAAGAPPTVTVNGATIVDPDIFATNGVIQGIDTVLVAPAPK
jgi:branched-chain amino acid transport system substrate-binding protein